MTHTEAEKKDIAAASRAWRSLNPPTPAQKAAARIRNRAWRDAFTPEQKAAAREYQRVWRATRAGTNATGGQA